jgi:hypothetical protein
MYFYLLSRCDSLIGIGKATRHHEFNNDEIGFCLLFISRNRLSLADCISTAIEYAILYLHIILLLLPDTFYLDESRSGFIRIRSVLRGRIRIRSKSVRIRNTGQGSLNWSGNHITAHPSPLPKMKFVNSPGCENTNIFSPYAPFLTLLLFFYLIFSSVFFRSFSDFLVLSSLFSPQNIPD